MRAFISGHVANSMAAEVIALLHSLLTAPESSAAQIWASAVKRVTVLKISSYYLCDILKCLGEIPQIVLHNFLLSSKV